MDTRQAFEPLSEEEREAAATDRQQTSGATSSCIEQLIPVPADAPPIDTYRHHKWGTAPAAYWPYHNEDGAILGYTCRWNTTDDGGSPDKEIRFLTFCRSKSGRSSWRLKGLPTPRPLYRLNDLSGRPDAPVLVVEGEKTADAASSIFSAHVATTSLNGVNAVDKSDWTPLAGRHVIMWPDADEPGARYARDVAACAYEVGAASVRLVSPPSALPEKWDLADPLPDGLSERDLRHALDTAEAVEAIASDWPFRTNNGWIERRYDHEGRSSWRRVCSEIEVIADTRDAQNEEWGRLLQFRDRDGHRKRWAMPMRMLSGDGEAYRGHLLSLGLVMDPGRSVKQDLNLFISNAQPGVKARCVSRVGWHGKVFVFDDEAIGEDQ